MSFWESLFLVSHEASPRGFDCLRSSFSLQWVLDHRDPRRYQPLTNWILSLPLEFTGDSAFESSSSLNWLVLRTQEQLDRLVKKSLSLVNILALSVGLFFNPIADKYVGTVLNNANTSYADVRSPLVVYDSLG